MLSTYDPKPLCSAAWSHHYMALWNKMAMRASCWGVLVDFTCSCFTMWPSWLQDAKSQADAAFALGQYDSATSYYDLALRALSDSLEQSSSSEDTHRHVFECLTCKATCLAEIGRVKEVQCLLSFFFGQPLTLLSTTEVPYCSRADASLPILLEQKTGRINEGWCLKTMISTGAGRMAWDEGQFFSIKR